MSIWQFIGVIVGVVAIFMTFLTLPSSAQGTALVGISIVCIISIIAFFTKNVVTLSLVTALFFFIAFIWFGLIAGLTYHQVPFFTENFGLDAPGVIYAKSDLGLALIIIEHILWFTVFFLILCLCIIKKNYIMLISDMLLYTFWLFTSIPNLFMPNFIDVKVLSIIDLDWPKTILGIAVSLLGFFGFVLFWIAPSNRRKRQNRLSK